MAICLSLRNSLHIFRMSLEDIAVLHKKGERFDICRVLIIYNFKNIFNCHTKFFGYIPSKN